MSDLTTLESRIKFSALAFLLILSVFCSFSCQGQGEAIDEYMSLPLIKNEFTGSVLVSKGGEILFHKGLGFANYEQEVPNETASVHRIGSLTKQMTAMAVLRLIMDKPDFDLHNKISNHMSGLPEGWADVTVYHLLTHTSGIPDLFGDLDAVPVEDTADEVDRVLKQVQSSTLRGPAGTTYRYSNFGYVLLGYLIEKVSETLYADYLQETIFKPLEMSNSFYDDPREIIKGRSQGYELKEGELVNDALKDPAAYAAGGLLSTTGDLFKWHRALKQDLILSDEIRELMFTPNKNNYGLGWQILEKRGRLMYNHNGQTHGFVSRMVYYPKEDIFIAILSNNADNSPAAMTCDLEGMLFENESLRPAVPVKLSEVELRSFIGVYETSEGARRSVDMRDDGLYFINENTWNSMTPNGSREFYATALRQMRIVFNAEGDLTLSACGFNAQVFRKVKE